MPIGALDSIITIGNAWKKNPDLYAPLWYLVRKSNPETAKMINPEDFDPEKIKVEGFTKESIIDPTINIILGAVQFVSLIDRLDDNLAMAVSAYNGGSGNIKNAVNTYWKQEGNPPVIPTNKPDFMEIYKRRNELGLKFDEKNENWVYLPRILAIYRKIYGPQAFSLAT